MIYRTKFQEDKDQALCESGIGQEVEVEWFSRCFSQTKTAFHVHSSKTNILKYTHEEKLYINELPSYICVKFR